MTRRRLRLLTVPLEKISKREFIMQYVMEHVAKGSLHDAHIVVEKANQIWDKLKEYAPLQEQQLELGKCRMCGFNAAIPTATWCSLCAKKELPYG